MPIPVKFGIDVSIVPKLQVGYRGPYNSAGTGTHPYKNVKLTGLGTKTEYTGSINLLAVGICRLGLPVDAATRSMFDLPYIHETRQDSFNEPS